MTTPPASPGSGQPGSAHRYPPPAPPGAAPTGPPPGAPGGIPAQGFSGGPSAPPGRDAGRPYPPSAPPPAYPAADAGKPSAYWPLSIIAVLFSIIFGAIGLYFSSEVGNRWNRGDRVGAQKASRTALILDIIGIVLGAILIIAALSSSGSGS